MAPGAGFNSPYPGHLLDIERVIAPVYVQLVQAVNCQGSV